MKGEGRKTRRRSYSPKVEALEALRLLDAAAPALAPLTVDHAPLPATPVPIAPPPPSPSAGHDAWDAALGQTALADLIAPRGASTAPPDASSVNSGLNQLNRYLSRAWSRAGIPVQQHDDCTQAVYATMLQNLGRTGFDQLLADVGQNGVREVLSRETSLGPDFFRAVDMVKKRAMRQRSHLALDDQNDLAAPLGSDGAAESWRGALQEAIARSLNPREADLIQATLKGYSPAEIASQWGVAPKTVSNEKTRALQKLREALVAELSD